MGRQRINQGCLQLWTTDNVENVSLSKWEVCSVKKAGRGIQGWIGGSTILKVLSSGFYLCPKVTALLLGSFLPLRQEKGRKAKAYNCKSAKCPLYQRTFLCVSSSNFCLCLIGWNRVTWSVVARKAGKWSFLAGYIATMNEIGILLVRKKGKISNW